jgi:hypothetical protein
VWLRRLDHLWNKRLFVDRWICRDRFFASLDLCWIAGEVVTSLPTRAICSNKLLEPSLTQAMVETTLADDIC